MKSQGEAERNYLKYVSERLHRFEFPVEAMAELNKPRPHDPTAATHSRSKDASKCNAVSGDAQAKCKDMADADYNAAKANAKASEVSTRQ
jgi:hypothetical protein